MKGLSIAYVKSVIEKAMSGKITTEQAAAKLGISRQYVNRLEKKYSEKGESAFVHGNRGRERKWKTSPKTEARILELRETKYRGFNFVHFLENLGELVQVDATFYDLFSFAGDHEFYALHGIIDDATGMILALRMDRRETLDGYRHVLLKMLKKYGICEEWYTDGRTVFCHGFDENGEPRGSPADAQFARWCRDLGICDMETFNARSDEIAEKHNTKFAVRPRIDDSRFVPIMMPDEELGILLSIRHRRTVHKGCCVQYDSKMIQLIKDDGTVLELGSKAEIEVRLTSDGEIYGCYDHRYYRARTAEEVTDDIASSFPSTREMN